jgi:TonB-dependent receptor
LLTGPARAQQPAPPAGPTPAPTPAPPAGEAPAAPADGAEGAEEMAVEEGEGEGLGDEMPKPDANNGVITGVVLDARSGEAVPDAQVVVVGTKHRAVADFEGNYGIKLPPGRYTVRVFFPGFKAKRIDNIAVVAGKASTVKVSLGGDEKAAQVEELVVETDAERTTSATQLLIRRKAATVSDAVSAQDIAKTPDRNAADAVRRIVGATVVDNRFVFVRGLGDRYTNSLLNGVPIPSPEPDTQAVPLDIFPTLVLSDLTVSKTFVPDMPGDFVGGSVNIHTRPFPDKFVFSASITAGVNTQATFRKVGSYRGGSTDWLGLDDGSRDLPGYFPNDRNAHQAPGGARFNLEQKAYYSRGLPRQQYRVYDTLAPPNLSANAVVGDRTTLWGRPLGWLVGLTYSRRQQFRGGEAQRVFLNQDLSTLNDFRGDRSNESVTLGGLGGLSLQADRNNRFDFIGLVTRNADDEVWRAEGFDYTNDASGDYRFIRRARWVERGLYYGQFAGEHRVPSLNSLTARYSLFYGQARRDEPSNVQSVYERQDDGRVIAYADTSLTHFFSQLRDNNYGLSFDVTQPVSRDVSGGAKLKFGTLLQQRQRDFGARRFRLPRVTSCDGCNASFELPPGALVDRNLGRSLDFEETTQSTDTYDGTQKIYAGYLMGDWPIVDKLRLIGGERLEFTSFDINTTEPFSANPQSVKINYQKTDLLPSLSAVYALGEKMNLRAAGTQTLARPQMRELVPFLYQESFGVFPVVGNPALRRTKVTNADLRWEWFPSSEEVLAVSVYYKYFSDPIERSIAAESTLGSRRPENAKSATNVGAEVEARKNLSFVSPALRALTFIGNLTLARSRIDVADSQRGVQLDLSRPLQGQSPWVVNAALDYYTPFGTRARLTYYVYGRRIDAVASGAPNIYEEARHVLDLTVAQNISKNLDFKFAAENVANSPVRFTQGDRYFNRFAVGTNLWATLTYTYLSGFRPRRGPGRRCDGPPPNAFAAPAPSNGAARAPAAPRREPVAPANLIHRFYRRTNFPSDASRGAC